MKSLCLVAALAAFGVAQGACADNNPNLKPYSLRLEVPSDSVSCGTRASSLGNIFAAQTGLTVTSAACQGTHVVVEGSTTYTTVTIVINYMAEAEAAPVQAIFSGSEFLGTPSEESGLFAKYSDCLKARGSQEASYVANTSLAVFASYCDLSTESSNSGYDLVIESFGTPKARLYSFVQDSSMVPASAQISQAVQTTIAQSGGTVALSDDAHVLYYAPSGPVSVSVSDLGFFSDPTQCQAQITEARTIFAKAHAVGTSAFCDAAAGSTYSTLTVVAANTLSIESDYGDTSAHYSTFADCVGDLNRVTQNAQSNGLQVLGGICRPSEDASATFQADLYNLEND